MAKIRNTSGDDLIVPWLGDRLVLAGQVVEVTDIDVYAFTQQTANWSPSGEAAQTAHDDAHAAYEERAGFEPTAEPQTDQPVPPARSASRDLWAAYVVGAGLATPEQVDGLGRDEIRDIYSSIDGSI